MLDRNVCYCHGYANRILLNKPIVQVVKYTRSTLHNKKNVWVLNFIVFTFECINACLVQEQGKHSTSARDCEDSKYNQPNSSNVITYMYFYVSLQFAISFSTCYRVCKRTAWILIRLRGCWSQTRYVGFVMTRLILLT
jgi:hypothetical protein